MAIQQFNPYQQQLMRDGEVDETKLAQLIENIGGAFPLGKSSGGLMSYLQNQQTQTQADPYAYGSYVIPASDPTYTSGFNYARTIAGGMPFEDVVAPGMSFSPEQPMGYTQADLNVVNLPRDVAPVFPTLPTKGEVYEASEPMMPYAPVGTPMPKKLFPLSQDILPDGLPNFFGKLPQFDLSQIQLPEIDVSQFVSKEEIPQLLKDIPIDIPQVDTSRFVSREEIPSLLPNIPKIDTSKFLTQQDITGLRSDILGSLPQIRMPDTSQFVTQQDINRAIAGIPQVSLSDIEERLNALEKMPSIRTSGLPRPLGLFA